MFLYELQDKNGLTKDIRVIDAEEIMIQDLKKRVHLSELRLVNKEIRSLGDKVARSPYYEKLVQWRKELLAEGLGYNGWAKLDYFQVITY